MFRRQEPSLFLLALASGSRVGTGRMRDTPPVGRQDAAFKAIECENVETAKCGARELHLIPRWQKVRQQQEPLLSAQDSCQLVESQDPFISFPAHYCIMSIKTLIKMN